MKYSEVRIETYDMFHDEVILMLQDFGIESIQEESLMLINELKRPKITWDYINPNIINLQEEQLIISFYLAEVDNPKTIIGKIEEIVKKKQWGKITIKEVKDEDWANEWKKYYKPLQVGKKLWVIPSWEKFEVEEDDIEIRLDPGMAFGSGTHETTYLCMEKIEEYIKQGDRVFDIGCGSGILSVVSAKLGANEVIGVDIDPVAIQASNENAILNGVDSKCKFFLGNLLNVVQGKANVIVSNIIAEIIIEMIPSLEESFNENGIFIGSGIILEKVEKVERKLLSSGFQVLEIEKKGEWAVIIAKRVEKMPRFFAENRDENFAFLSKKDTYHLTHVLRKGIGSKIEVVEGGVTYSSLIEEIGENKAKIRLIQPLEKQEQSGLHIHLYQGIPKGSKMEMILQHGTEVGINEYTPVQLQRCVSKISGKEEKKIERWKKIVESAAKQSGRNVIPKVNYPIGLKQLVDELSEDELLIVPYEEENSTKISDVLREYKGENIKILIGPEGGIDSEEIKKIIEAGAKTVTLGSRILRTETAAIISAYIMRYEKELR